MKTDEYRAEFERETGFAPTEEFLRHVGHPPQRACGEQPPEAALSEPQAAQKAGMTDEALFGCLKYEAACARGQSPGGALPVGLYPRSRAGRGLNESGDRLAGGTAGVKKIARGAVFSRRPPVGGSETFLAGRGLNESKNKPKTGANPTRAGTQKGQDDEDWRLPQALRRGARARGGLRRRLSAYEKGLETGKSRALIGAASGYISNRSACEPVLVRDKIS